MNVQYTTGTSSGPTTDNTFGMTTVDDFTNTLSNISDPLIISTAVLAALLLISIIIFLSTVMIFCCYLRQRRRRGSAYKDVLTTNMAYGGAGRQESVIMGPNHAYNDQTGGDEGPYYSSIATNPSN